MESSTMTSRLFLTGGSGYVGRNLIRHFTARGTEVVALTRSARSAEVVQALGAVPWMGDLLDANLADGMSGCQALIHAAADTSHGRGTTQQVRTNLEGTRNVFASAHAAGLSRAVHISSESVLLDGQPLINASEDHPLPRRPAGAYSHTKGNAERVALSLAAPGFEVVVIRPRFVWGRDDTTALPHLAATAASGQLAWIDGGHYRTSTTHIANVCEGVARALDRGRSGEVYFITDGAPVEFRSFITSLLETQGLEAPQKSVPRWLLRSTATVGGLLEDLSRGRLKSPISLQEFATMAVEVTLDITKARTELGYSPVITREEGLAELKAAATRPSR
ncbi:NAD-dependent epimerase/dehydratase family protein [Archangium lansingense]|uniref:NAD-dependent epimerase/dehydratase family protein n=1 Tax=Archangium lansingense TaxID=2995310 RepID=A0ABT3ZWA9_9BACT|nr:NAD-dependent epimerase/dehydratase family protein [Archangium lansinium]MCY1073029.1 NAD-dependent epimerase/dehydratase family protein [Archangium lansinium]